MSSITEPTIIIATLVVVGHSTFCSLGLVIFTPTVSPRNDRRSAPTLVPTRGALYLIVTAGNFWHLLKTKQNVKPPLPYP